MTQEAVRKYEIVEDLPGVGPSTSEKLKELGFHTIESLATATVRELVPAGIGEKQAAKIIAEARDSISLSFVRADELMKMKANVRRLTTGSKAFDGLIGGGLETQTITEFYGEYGVGKSILCHQLAINVQLPVDKGGLDGGALYLDTEQTFRPEWIVRMAKTAGLEPTDIAQRIIYSEAYNSDHQILLLEKADQIIKDNNIRLIIIDSLTSHFRSEYIGREMLAERQQRLNNHMHRLIRLARGFNAVAIVTNQVMAKPDQFFANSVDAVGGHIVAHTSHTRVFLRRAANGPIRIARLVSSPYLPEGERIFKATEGGIVDVSEEDEVKRRRQRRTESDSTTSGEQVSRKRRSKSMDRCRERTRHHTAEVGQLSVVKRIRQSARRIDAIIPEQR